MIKRETIQHYRTSGNTAPLAENLAEGELALNISTGETAIYMKDVDDNIHTFKDSAYNDDKYIINGENEKDATITRSGEEGEAAQIAISTDGINLTVSPSDAMANTQLSMEDKKISIMSTMDDANGNEQSTASLTLDANTNETALYNKNELGYGKISYEDVYVGNPYGKHRAGVYTTYSQKQSPPIEISGEIATHKDLFKIKKSIGSKKTKDKMEPNVSHATSQSPMLRYGDCVFCSPKAKNYLCNKATTNDGNSFLYDKVSRSTNGKILYELNRRDCNVNGNNTDSVTGAYYFYWDSTKKGYYIHISNEIYSHFGDYGVMVIAERNTTTSILYTFPDREDTDVVIFYDGLGGVSSGNIGKLISVYILCEPSSFDGGEAGCVLWNKGSDITKYKGTKRDNGAPMDKGKYKDIYYSSSMFKKANVDRRAIGRWVKVKRHEMMFRVRNGVEEWAPQTMDTTLLPSRLKGVLQIKDFASMICNNEDREYQVWFRVAGKNNKRMKWRPFCKNNAGIALNNIREYSLIQNLSRDYNTNELCIIDKGGNVLEDGVTIGNDNVLYRLVNEDDGGQLYTVAFYYSTIYSGHEKFHVAKRLITNSSAENLYTKDEDGKYVKCASGDVVEDGVTYYEYNSFYDFPDWFGEAEQKANDAVVNEDNTWSDDSSGYTINGKVDCLITSLDTDKITNYIYSLFDKYPISFTNTHRNRYVDFAIFEVTRPGKYRLNYETDTRYRTKAVCKPVGLLYRVNASVDDYRGQNGPYNGKYNVKSRMQPMGTINYFNVPR